MAELLLPGDAAGHALERSEQRLAAGDGVVNALTGNALLLGDLCQREILIVIEVKIGLLLFGQQRAVGVEEQGHGKGFLFHDTAPP